MRQRRMMRRCGGGRSGFGGRGGVGVVWLA